LRSWLAPPGVELAHLLPGLGEPPAGPAGPAAQTRLFELLLGLLGRLAEQAPITLVVEDLHWADRSTRALLAFLARNLRRERVLLVVTYRNDETDSDGLRSYLAEVDRGARVVRTELARLDRAETATQLSGILGGAPSAELLRACCPLRGQPLLHRGAARERPTGLRFAPCDVARPAEGQGGGAG
jgi:predicted ATPase